MPDASVPWWQRLPTAVVLSLLMAVFVVVTAPGIGPDAGMRRIDGIGVALAVAAAGALLLAWLDPWLMVVAVTVLLAVYWGMKFTGGPVMLCGPLAIFRFGLLKPRREMYAAAAGMVGVLLVVVLVTGRAAELGELGAVVAFAAAAAFGADAIRQRARRRAAELEARRRQQVQGVAEQQLSLARELHDGIAHSLTAIAVQATLVERTARSNPDAAAEAASAIAATTRTALADLNTILKSLRRPGEAPHTPARGLADIAELVAQGERSGHRVRLREQGDRHAVHPPERVQAAYRVVQEALTNATRYAPGSTVVIEVRHSPGLMVRVADDGPASDAVAAVGSGYGLIGMAERVSATGGVLRHGPRSPRGFEVEASWES